MKLQNLMAAGVEMHQASFTLTVKVTIFVSGCFDCFNVLCKRHHKATFNPILNGKKTDDIDGKYEQELSLYFLYATK